MPVFALARPVDALGCGHELRPPTRKLVARKKRKPVLFL
jgi:hypothetical protein